ncbi:P-loop NTPase fold protein [Massilia sp. W12]|uniref:KAP family P-loop NTPase fold protein n=1 Tax=Massilia sp. W12 TaxID=3126507 RepID=UPI0030D4EE3C
MNLDADVARSQEDPFGRAEFAAQLAQFLRQAPQQDSLVLGLEGEWGGGKSWVIERVCKLLKARGDTVVLQFNPWLIGSENELIAAFMDELAAQLHEFAEVESKLSKELKGFARSLAAYGEKLSYLKYLKYVPGVAPIGQFVADHEKEIREGREILQKLGAESRPSLHGARKQIQQALQALDKTVVVVIDDLDRLRKQEIQTMVQLVKAVANFRGVHYLLAYDARYVAQAICYDGNIASGFAYLEKIVQLACHLPPLTPWIFRDWLHAECLRFLAQQSWRPSPFEEAQLDEAMWFVSRLLRHPRDAKRWLNRLRWVFGSLEERLNLGDVLVMEALQIVTPETLRVLFKSPHYLFAPREMHFAADEYGLYSTADTRSAWREVAAPEEEVQRALCWLFPQLEHSDFAYTPDADAHAHMRLQLHTHFRMYLNITSMPAKHDGRMVCELLQDPVRYARLPNRFVNHQEFAQFCHQILDFLSLQNVRDAAHFFNCICQTASQCFTRDVLAAHIEICARVLRRLLDLMAPEAQMRALDSMLSSAPLSLSGVVLQRADLHVTHGDAWRTALQEQGLRFLEKDNVFVLLACVEQRLGLYAARRLVRQALSARQDLALLKTDFEHKPPPADWPALWRFLPAPALMRARLQQWHERGYQFALTISWLETPEVLAQCAQLRRSLAAQMRQARRTR